jgi:hypothetical protein
MRHVHGHATYLGYRYKRRYIATHDRNHGPVPAATYLVFNLVSEAVPATALARRMQKKVGV